jgi:hypothetical protein
MVSLLYALSAFILTTGKQYKTKHIKNIQTVAFTFLLI